jgi:hypothetical protein
MEVAVDMQLAKDCWSKMPGYYCCIDSLAQQHTVMGTWPTLTNYKE